MQALADKGIDTLRVEKQLLNAVNAHQGKITCHGVAESLGYAYVKPLAAFGL